MKIKHLFYFLLLFSAIELKAQNIGINNSGATPNAAALLDIDATGISPKMGLLIPRVTSAQKTAMDPLPAAAQGLLVYQTNGIEGFYYNTSTTVNPAWLYISPSNSGWTTTGNTSTTIANFIGTTDLVSFRVRTNNIQQMIIDSTGKVGIGKSIPTRQLQVAGGSAGSLTNLLSLWSNCSTCGNLNTSTGIKFSNTNGVNEDLGSVEITATRNVSGGSGDFGVRAATGTPTMAERLRITGADGFVGINSNNSAPAAFAPSSALHIRERNTALNDILSIEKFSTTNGQVAGIRFRVGNSATVNEEYKGAIYFERTGTSARGSLHFATNDVNLTATNVSPTDIRMSITSAGDVGIGTQAPAAKLEVAGTTRTTNFQMTSGANLGYVLGGDAAGNASWVSPSSFFTPGTGLSVTGIVLNSVWTASGANIYNNNTANVGIGTTTPSQLLHVSGGSILTNRAIAASTVTVAASTIPFTTGGTAATQVRISNNASATANGNLTYGATAIEGQYLWITNFDAQSIPFTSTSPTTTIPANKTMGFVYVNSSWQPVTADQANAQNWSLTGNSGTSSATNFIGTTDSTALVFKINNYPAGRIGLMEPTADYNTSIGAYSLTSNTTGDHNTAFGTQALVENTTGTYNTAVGVGALQNNTTGIWNTAIGSLAMQNNINGVFNTAVGTNSLFSNTSGSANLAMGLAAMFYNTTGSNNTALGYTALTNHTINGQNTAIGRSALYSDVSGSENTALGYQAMYNNLDGIGNTGLGIGTLQYNNTGDYNVAVGYHALRGNSAGTNNSNNVALGSFAGYNNSLGYNNVFVGNRSGYTNTNGHDNVFFGDSAGYYNTTGYDNLFYGNSSGIKNTTGYNNLFSGNNSGYKNTTGRDNIFMGNNSGYSNTTGYENIFIGLQSGSKNTTSGENIYIGTQSGFNSTGAVLSTAVGYRSGYTLTSGTSNSLFGAIAGYYITTGEFNTMIGLGTGDNIVTGDFNTFIGEYASSNGDYTNSAAFGANATVSASNYQRFGDDGVLKWGFGTNGVVGRCFVVGTTASNGFGAYLTNGGAWTNASDRNKKTDITPLDGNDILFKIRQLDITRWRYKGTTEGDEYHIGPMAQDFYRLFNVGIDSLSISTIDPAGISLIGVKELSKQLEEMKKQNAVLKTENAEIKNELLQLKTATKEEFEKLYKKIEDGKTKKEE